MKHETLIRRLPLNLERKDEPDPLVELKQLFTDHHGEVKKIGDQVKAWNDRVDDIEKKINRARLFGRGGGSDFEDAGALEAERKAIGAYIKAGNEAGLKEYTVGSDPQGGYLVQPQRSAVIMKRLFDGTPMRRLARIVTLTGGDGFEEPVDPDDIGADWAGETQSRPETDSGEVGLHSYPLAEIYAMQKVSQKLLDTSDLDVGAWIDGKIADKFMRSEGTAFIVGDGIGKPRGFMSYAANSVTTADAHARLGSAAERHLGCGDGGGRRWPA